MAPIPPLPTAADVIADVDAAVRALAIRCDGGREHAAVLFLDPERRYLGRVDFAGTRDAIAVPLRVVVAEALRRDAAALILGHSHPSGSAAPSAADLAYTRQLARTGAALGLTLIDHLILTDDHVTSLRCDGLL